MRSLQQVEGISIEALQVGLRFQWPFTSFPEYLHVLEHNGVVINVAAYVGHSPMRLYVMSEDSMKRAASPDEIVRMCALLSAIVATAANSANNEALVPRHHQSYERLLR